MVCKGVFNSTPEASEARIRTSNSLAPAIQYFEEQNLISTRTSQNWKHSGVMHSGSPRLLSKSKVIITKHLGHCGREAHVIFLWYNLQSNQLRDNRVWQFFGYDLIPLLLNLHFPLQVMGDLFYVETFTSRCNIVISAGYCLLVDQACSNTSCFF